MVGGWNEAIWVSELFCAVGLESVEGVLGVRADQQGPVAICEWDPRECVPGGDGGDGQDPDGQRVAVGMGR